MNCILAKPRGFCAGVERAINIVEKAIEKFGKPVYVRHEIVHNRFVVEQLKEKGAIFVENLNEIPSGAIVIFSAHGVSRKIYETAKELNLVVIDATCPLVKSVHRKVQEYAADSRFIILIGHPGHTEIEGTLGQLPEGGINLISSVEDVEKLPGNAGRTAYLTQTTLSTEDTADVIAALRQKFPDIQGAKNGNICYATTNRQNAVRSVCKKADLLLIVGSQNSSNSNRLRELGEEQGVKSFLIDSVADLQKSMFDGVSTVGISSGASAPEHLVLEIIDFLKDNFAIDKIYEEKLLEENKKFPLPDGLL